MCMESMLFIKRGNSEVATRLLRNGVVVGKWLKNSVVVFGGGGGALVSWVS